MNACPHCSEELDDYSECSCTVGITAPTRSTLGKLYDTANRPAGGSSMRDMVARKLARKAEEPK